MASLKQLYEVNALASYDKQLCLAKVVGDRSWNADLWAGELFFGDDLQFDIQVIGSQSDYDNTWLWAWANDESGLPQELLRASEQLRGLGASLGVSELTTAKFDLGGIDGHYIAMVASGLCHADCYYRAPYDEGAVFLLIPEAREVREQADLSAHFIVGQVMDFISGATVNHRLALERYLNFKGYSFEYEGQQLFATSSHDECLTAEFDNQGRIRRMETVVSPPIRNLPRERC